MVHSNGNVTGQQGHYPFGESWYLTNTTTEWLFTAGVYPERSRRERDSESGNDYATFRYNVNRLGRFASPDLLGGLIADPQSLNRYTYVRGDPVNLVDPLGLTDNLYCDPDTECGDGGGSGGGGSSGGGDGGGGGLDTTYNPGYCPPDEECGGGYEDDGAGPGAVLIQLICNDPVPGQCVAIFVVSVSQQLPGSSGHGSKPQASPVGAPPQAQAPKQPSKLAQFGNCVKSVLGQTFRQTLSQFGHNLAYSFKAGVPLGLAIGGALIGAEPELAPAAPAVLGLSTGGTVSTFVGYSVTIFAVGTAADLVGAPAFCAEDTF